MVIEITDFLVCDPCCWRWGLPSTPEFGSIGSLYETGYYRVVGTKAILQWVEIWVEDEEIGSLNIDNSQETWQWIQREKYMSSWVGMCMKEGFLFVSFYERDLKIKCQWKRANREK